MSQRLRSCLKAISLVVVVIIGTRLLLFGWNLWQIRSLTAECSRLEQAGSWGRLLRTARKWKSYEPESRQARQKGATAGRALRDVNAVKEFLEGYPCELTDDVPWRSMLCDLKFGPLNDPFAGAELCREILKVQPDHRDSHRRLVFFYAMLQQQVAMQDQIQAALQSGCELPEVFVYSFLGPGLQLRNGIPATERWLTAFPQSEQLLVARALHFARSVEGAVPTNDESEAEKVRQLQSERTEKLGELLAAFPANQELQAYHVSEFIQSGDLLRAGEVLTKTASSADLDFRFWHARGWVFARIREFEEAERCYRHALSLHCLDWRTHFHLAELLRAIGRMDESVAAGELASDGRSLERELLLQPDMLSVSEDLYVRLAKYSQQCGAETYTKCLQRYLNKAGGSQKSPVKK